MTVEGVVSTIKCKWREKEDEHRLEIQITSWFPLSLIAAKLPAGKKRRAVSEWYQKLDKKRKKMRQPLSMRLTQHGITPTSRLKQQPTTASLFVRIAPKSS